MSDKFESAVIITFGMSPFVSVQSASQSEPFVTNVTLKWPLA